MKKKINLKTEVTKALIMMEAKKTIERSEKWTEIAKGVIKMVKEHVQKHDTQEALIDWIQMTGQFITDLTASDFRAKNLLSKAFKVIGEKNNE